MVDWRPSYSIESLHLRARLLAQVRAFFLQRDVVEVETPLLGLHTVTEPNIESFNMQAEANTRWLQTSPEYAMKRLLAAGAGDIYQICKSFRVKESGANHNPEFTLVEWYRREFTLQQIMQETIELICSLLFGVGGSCDVNYITYTEATQQVLNGSMLEMSSSKLEKIVVAHGLVHPQSLSLDQQYDYIFSNVVAPTFDTNKLTVVFHYPASQASLAKLVEDNAMLAQRFEVFFGDLELANGFVELTDAEEQLCRFKKDQEMRANSGLPAVEIDPRLLAALQYGLPNCAGVAVGFDRVAMLASNAASISEIISFDWASA